MTKAVLRNAHDLRERLEPFLNKEYRDAYLEGHVKAGVAYQIQSIRNNLELTQVEFAVILGKTQSAVSRLEDNEYSGTINTLLDIAKSLGIALSVRFCSYPSLLQTDMSSAAMRVDNINQSFSGVSQEVLAYQKSGFGTVFNNTAITQALEGGGTWNPRQGAIVDLFQGSGMPFIERFMPTTPLPHYLPSISP